MQGQALHARRLQHSHLMSWSIMQQVYVYSLWSIASGYLHATIYSSLRSCRAAKSGSMADPGTHSMHQRSSDELQQLPYRIWTRHVHLRRLDYSPLSATFSPDPATWIQQATPQFFSYTVCSDYPHLPYRSARFMPAYGSLMPACCQGPSLLPLPTF